MNDACELVFNVVYLTNNLDKSFLKKKRTHQFPLIVWSFSEDYFEIAPCQLFIN